MAYFEFPHTRTYDSDLGWLIKKIGEILDFDSATSEWIAKHEAEYQELKDLYDKVMSGDLPQSVEDFLDNWMSENARDLIEEYINSEAGKAFERVANKNFNALLFTDIHYIHNTIAGNTAHDKLENIKNFINSFQDVDVAFSLGDQTNDNYPLGQSGSTGLVNNTQELMSANYLWTFEQPVYWLQGNHDSYPSELWDKYYPNKKQFYVESNPVDFICLNVYGDSTSPAGSGGAGLPFGAVDVDFLDESLRKAERKVIILAHDLRTANITPMVQSVLNAYRSKIICIFTGHYHHYFEETFPLASGALTIYHLPSIGGDPFVWYGNNVIPVDWEENLDTADKWSAARIYTDETGLHFSLISMPTTYTYNGVDHVVTREVWKTVDLDPELTSEGNTNYKQERAQHLEATAKLGFNNIEHPLLSIMENINSGDDLNNFVTPGTYKANTGTVAGSLVNAPALTTGFIMYVFHPTSNNHDGSYCTQIIITNNSTNPMFIRQRSNGTWSAWNEFINTANYQMHSSTFSNGSMDIDLSTKIDLAVPVPGTVIIIPVYRRRTSIDKLYGSITLCDGVHTTTYTVNITASGNTLNVVGAFKITDGSTIESFTPVYLLYREVGASIISFYY